jgi:hypothetical protein
MKSKLQIFVFLLLLVFSVQGQENNVAKEHVVNYKDGSIFRGRIIDSNGGYLTMLITTGDTISLQIDQITKFFDPSDYLLTRKGKYHLKSGFFNYTSVSTGFNNSGISQQLQTMLGYRISERKVIGLGLSLEGHDVDIADNFFYHRFVTPYAYGRHYFNNAHWRFYADAKMGYAVDIEPNWRVGLDGKDGFIFQPGIGFKIASRNRAKILLSMSYAFLRTEGSGVDWMDISYDYKVWIKRLLFTIGFELW